MPNSKLQRGTSLLSLLLAAAASSHHWLHMGVLLLVGGAGMPETMGAVIGLRRAMIATTLVTVAFSLYRLYRHRCKEPRMLTWTGISALLSIGFVVYTVLRFGW